MKTELAELEGGLGFMEDSCGQLVSLISPPESPEKPCVETVAFSSFNPVPGYRRYSLLRIIVHFCLHTEIEVVLIMWT